MGQVDIRYVKLDISVKFKELAKSFSWNVVSFEGRDGRIEP
jgi:hypothetical protein